MSERQRKFSDDTDEPAIATDLDALIGYNLKRAYMIVQSDFRAALGTDGLAPRVFSVLSLVVQTPNITQSELARTLGIERSGLVAIVDDLEERGYVSRAAVPGDRRVQALIARPLGRRAYTDAVRKVRAHEKRLLSALSESEKQSLLDLLMKIRQLEVLD